MALSDTAIRNAKSKDGPITLHDLDGLFILVAPSGSKLWRFKYRFDGKEKKLALGVYPAISHKDARKLRDEARELVAKGIDPGEDKKQKAVAASIQASNTFKLVAEEYIAKLRDDGMAPATEKKTLWLLKQLEPALGKRPIAEIEPIEVLNVLRFVERKGNLETTHRLRSFCSRVFKYAIWTTRAKIDPADALTGALRTPKITHHAAIIDPEGVGALLMALDAFEGFKPLGAALKLSPHVFVRPGELRKAEWTEFNFEDRTWHIPASRMKMKRDHWVPLSSQAIKILIVLKEITGAHPYLFPSIRDWTRPMSENAVNVTLRRHGFASHLRSP